jgi:membrane-associated phospholipid phosphatase
MECPRKAACVSESAEKALIAAVLLALTVPMFFAVGALTPNHVPAAWLSTRWDASIPLLPAAVWPYFSWYLAPFLLLAAPRDNFRRAAAAIALAFAACMLIYLLLPAYLERPVVSGETQSERALLLLYRYDPPWNIFPSFHAAMCAILWRPAFGGWLARRLMPVWMSAICAACILTKQHHVLDVVAGMLVGFLAVAAVNALFRRLSRMEQAAPGDTAHWMSAAQKGP